MTDRELLEMAAKAEGRTLKYMTQHIEGREPEEFIACWNPLTDDGDAFRLSVNLCLGVKHFAPCNMPGIPQFGMVEIWRELEADPTYVGWYKPKDDLCAATRRAIVRAAAEIGELK